MSLGEADQDYQDWRCPRCAEPRDGTEIPDGCRDPECPTALAGKQLLQPWRAIRCADVDWGATPGVPEKPRQYKLYRQCSPDSYDKDTNWSKLTLGELADMGEKKWRGVANFGMRTIWVIMRTIDYAAAGFDVTKKATTTPYIPRPWKDKT